MTKNIFYKHDGLFISYLRTTEKVESFNRINNNTSFRNLLNVGELYTVSQLVSIAKEHKMHKVIPDLLNLV